MGQHGSEIHCLPSHGPYSLTIPTPKGTAVPEVRFMAVTVKQRFKPTLLLNTNFVGNPKSFTLSSELEKLPPGHERPPQTLQRAPVFSPATATPLCDRVAKRLASL